MIFTLTIIIIVTQMCIRDSTKSLMHSIISSESASNNMDNHCTNADCLTFGELVLVTLDRVPAKYYNHLARFKSVITQLPEANAEITTFSDFIHTYDYIKTKPAAYLSEQESVSYTHLDVYKRQT